MRKRFLKFVFVVLLCCGGLTQAVPITIQITGNVTSIGGTGRASVSDTIYAGVSFIGTYTYDSATPDSDANPQRGSYLHNSPYGISIALGGYEFKTASSHVGQFKISITNDDATNFPAIDYYSVFSDKNASVPSAGLTIDYISWTLGDSTHSVFSSDALPVTVPMLTDWNYNVLAISGDDSLGHSTVITCTVTQAELVPEPMTSILTAIGIIFFRRRR
jgi:hypothetical protein